MALIESYRFGNIVIEGENHTRDLIILPGGEIISNWQRNKGHIFDSEDCRRLLDSEPEFIIFGIGAYSLVKLAPDLIAELNRRDIAYEAAKTKQAVEIYNQSGDKRTGAAFHLTC